MTQNWTAKLARDAKKQYEKLKRSGLKKPSIIDTIDFLLIDLEQNDPALTTWPNYGTIEESKSYIFHHCHIRTGRPTYVACWRVTNEMAKKIEVFYVGSHEDAPY